jgi:hypothetical protein
MHMKKLMLAGALVLAGTSASLAQGTYAPPGYGRGYYQYSPGSGLNDQSNLGYQGSYSYGWQNNDTDRGGPGPRVGAGSGAGIGSQR